MYVKGAGGLFLGCLWLADGRGQLIPNYVIPPSGNAGALTSRADHLTSVLLSLLIKLCHPDPIYTKVTLQSTRR